MRARRPLALLVASCLTAPAFAGTAAAAASTTWTSAAATPAVVQSGPTLGAPFRPPALPLPDGRAVLFDSTSRGFVYRPDDDSWSRTATGAPTGTAQAATALADGRVLVTGGAAAAVWDPAGDTWSALPAPVEGYAPAWAVTLADGRVLTGSATGASLLWHPTTGWSDTTTAMAYAHGAGAAVVPLTGGHVLVAGGATAPAGAEVFDPDTLLWAPVTGLRPRSGAVGVALADGRALVVGGTDAGTDGAPLATTDVYDPAAGTLAAGPTLGAPRSEPLATRIAGASVLVVGGTTTGGGTLATAEVVDVAAGLAEPAGASSVPRAGGALVTLLDGRALAVGGAATLAADLYHPPVTAQPTITAPAPDAVLTGVVAVAAASGGASTVRFLLDGEPIVDRPGYGGAATFPFVTYGWAEGPHALTARICNATGCGPASAPVPVTIDNAEPVLTSPEPGQTIRGPVTLAATTTAGGVRFLLDGAPIGTDRHPPYELELNPFSTTTGAHTVGVQACDVEGRCEGALSAAVPVTVDTRPTLTEPLAGATVNGEVGLSATSAAPAVRFYVAGEQVGAPVPPVGNVASAVWSTYGYADGTYDLTARGCDPTHGCTEASEARTVTVDNPAPTLVAPAAGATVTTPVTLDADAPGGRVRFELDGTPVGGPVAAPYQVTLDPANHPGGAHTLVARSCSTAGDRCEGPVSEPVSFTTSPRPEVAAPTDGATVAGLVPLRAQSPAAAVRFLVDGVAVGEPVPTVNGVAETQWHSYGLPNGPHTVGVVACDPGCAEAVREVDVTLANAAPVLTGPAPGAVLGDAVTLTATAPPGSGVAFEVDGVQVGFDGTAPYAYRWATAGWALGGHVVRARSCAADGSVCQGPTSAERGVALAKLNPRVDAVVPRAISPNGDRVQDAMTLTYTVDLASTVVLRVFDSANRQVYARNLGTLPAGRRTFVWTGVSSAGARVPNGTYLMQLETARPAHGGTLRGLARVGGLGVDVTRPPVGAFSLGGTFYPVPDGYADTFSPAFTLGERGSVVLRVVDSAGRAVFVRGATYNPGRVAMTWNGRLPSGAVAPAGTYRFQWTVTDAAGNRSVSGVYPVNVSTKRLVGRQRSRDVVPASSVIGVFEGACASTGSPGHSQWPGSIGYYSECYADGYSDSDVVLSRHEFTLPAAPRYGWVQVDAVGQSPWGDAAVLFYDYPTSPDVVMQPAYGRYALPRVPATAMPPRKVRWIAGTANYNWYVVRTFRVTWVEYVLV